MRNIEQTLHIAGQSRTDLRCAFCWLATLGLIDMGVNVTGIAVGLGVYLLLGVFGRGAIKEVVSRNRTVI